MKKWFQTNLPWLWKSRWFLTGAVAYLAVLGTSSLLRLTHSAGRENHYSIAWTYVTLVVAIISILYPLALTIRDSLTARLFAAYGRLKESGSIEDEEFRHDFYNPLRRFRTILFDIQLPILATFSLLSVVRVLLCLMSLGPLSVEQQMLEPQLYILAYLAWIVWVATVLLWLRPYYLVETAETKVLGLPVFEQSFKQELKEQASKNGAESSTE